MSQHGAAFCLSTNTYLSQVTTMQITSCSMEHPTASLLTQSLYLHDCIGVVDLSVSRLAQGCSVLHRRLHALGLQGCCSQVTDAVGIMFFRSLYSPWVICSIVIVNWRGYGYDANVLMYCLSIAIHCSCRVGDPPPWNDEWYLRWYSLTLKRRTWDSKTRRMTHCEPARIEY